MTYCSYVAFEGDRGEGKGTVGLEWLGEYGKKKKERGWGGYGRTGREGGERKREGEEEEREKETRGRVREEMGRGTRRGEEGETERGGEQGARSARMGEKRKSGRGEEERCEVILIQKIKKKNVPRHARFHPFSPPKNQITNNLQSDLPQLLTARTKHHRQQQHLKRQPNTQAEITILDNNIMPPKQVIQHNPFFHSSKNKSRRRSQLPPVEKRVDTSKQPPQHILSRNLISRGRERWR